MPTLETPPNPAPQSAPPEASPKVRTGRFGELDHHEIVHLLDSLDDERSRSRFRESIYVSIIIYIALAWFVFYGPRVLFHQGRIINPGDALRQRDKELTYLNLPKDLSKLPPPKSAKAISDKSSTAQTAHPTIDRKTLEQLQAMRRAGAPGAPAAKPLPETPQPQTAQPQTAQPQAPPPQAATPQPQPRPLPQQASAAIPDAPHPSTSTRPSFSTPANPGQSIRDAARAAAAHGGAGGDYGANAPLAHQGRQSGVEVLSDTLGTDFGPYLRRLHQILYNSWVPLIPEETLPPLSKEGTTIIRFTIQPNGVVSAMHLDDSTHDAAIDKAAWGSITGVGQMPPLPSSFNGPELELRYTFVITHDHSRTE